MLQRPSRSIHCLAIAVFSLVGSVFLTSAVTAQDSDGFDARYARMQSLGDRIKSKVYRDSVKPKWFGENSDRFWYQVQTGANTHEFITVDAQAGTRKRSFDHQALADALTEQTDTQYHADRLPLKRLRFEGDPAHLLMVVDQRAWQFELPNGPLIAQDDDVSATALKPLSRLRRSRSGTDETKIRFVNQTSQKLDISWIDFQGDPKPMGQVEAGKSVDFSTYCKHIWMLSESSGKPVALYSANESADSAIFDGKSERPEMKWDRHDARKFQSWASPDGKFAIDIRDDNIVLKNTEDKSESMLTTDGTPEHRYGPDVYWSPQSDRFFVLKTRVGQGREITIVKSSPDGSVHPELKTIRYEKPGDQRSHSRPVLFAKSNDWKPETIEDDLFPNPFALGNFHWHSSGSRFSFLYNQRGHQRHSLISVDANSNQPRVAIDETSDTFICYSGKTYLHRIDDTDELIWMSERSGWNHLYLIDQVSGEVKNPVTHGDWVVRSVEHVDDQKRQIWLIVSGIDADQDPYQRHLIRVNFDGTQLTRLTSGDGDHTWQFSPDRRFLIDTMSRVDLAPVTVLRSADTGDPICELERSDIASLLETGWQLPRRFVAKARDGVTDIHGIIIRPTNFDPLKKYPVVENIYAGPHSSFVPKAFGVHRGLYEIAELGFIVVKIDGMGTSNRSKAFHDVCWKHLHDSGFPDRIRWIQAAAADRPWMDLTRVGIYGGSAGGQSAMRALIDHHDFYHVAVADCGCHDNRVDKIWWNEQWMGWPIGKEYSDASNVDQAHRMQGRLMLIWGELDTNVDPASTMQVVNALIKADKDFDMLCIPGAGHGAAGHPYGKRRQAEFLMRHLQ
ncbi:Prolyl tripeptidyl peptidase precursor [Rubripirellula lacrimiformis]|uniref:Prolyl tripeptidyl peptidase n=1 Tax=Rubripirellula lacrimiformis TaxID=1930273 RepID=A0A517NDZ1_9BACT|nr:prolyl oligopeptidase family serine peptidase [Rubripirellula lacrimiformis]QDT05278.1 Prolyl tripeptidyl peptidase precursor [Rubripirellula lacrimiformis]